MIKNRIIKNIVFFLLANFLIFFNLAWHIAGNPILNLFNIILASLLWIIISDTHGNYWLNILYIACVNEFFQKTAFGLTALPLIFTLIFMHWLLLNIFTNRSLITVFLSGLSAVLIYRLLFVISNFLYYSSKNESLINMEIIKTFLAESLFTASLLALVYLISAFFVKRFHPEYVSRGHIL